MVIDSLDFANNEQDRRILYEVLGMRIYRDEFLGEDSDDGGPLLPIDYAFMYGNYDDGD